MFFAVFCCFCGGQDKSAKFGKKVGAWSRQKQRGMTWGKQKSIAKIRLVETKEIPLCEAKIYVNRKQEEKGKIRMKNPSRRILCGL